MKVIIMMGVMVVMYVVAAEFGGEGGDEGNDICDCRLAFATVKSGNF